MRLISLYNIIDLFCIAGLGADEVAAVGFVISLEFLIISIGTSMGVGITSVNQDVLDKRIIKWLITLQYIRSYYH
ncbi:MAG: hypothetical protein IJJ47_05155 [Methanosphaera sp.]|nr:hypothetical protein [Methanosphaera sp.]